MTLACDNAETDSLSGKASVADGWVVKVRGALLRDKFLILAVIAGLASLVTTYHAVVSENSPDDGLQAVSAVFDAGEVRQGIVSAKFELVNRSKVPQRILHIVKSCRCSEIDASTEEIVPSQSTTIKCRWDTSGLRGNVKTGFVVVYSEGPGKKLAKLSLTLQGEVIPEFDFFPPRIEFTEGEAATRSICLVPRTSESKVVVEKASCAYEAFKVLLRNEREIRVSFSPELWVSDPYLNVKIEVVTNCKTDQRCEIPVRIMEKAGSHSAVLK